MRLKKNKVSTLSQFIGVFFIIIALILTIGAVENFTTKNDDSSASTERDLIERYAIQCYASEGSYPPNLEYLETHYGLLLKKERYGYYYEVFASNVLPDIRVIQLVRKNKFGE